jgi:hypothetical protein
MGECLQRYLTCSRREGQAPWPRKPFRGKDLRMLDDGSYDAIVVDATDDGDAIAVDLAILAGPRKGEVVTVRAVGLGRESLELLGIPATIVVTRGEPAVTFEP